MLNAKFNIAGQLISDTCRKCLPNEDDLILLEALQSIMPSHQIKLAFRSNAWYRLGGVVDIEGNRIAKDLVEWVERTFIECGQNLQTLIDYTLEQQFIATKQTGTTLYFSIQTGSRAEDFVLIEMDKTHEVSDRWLVDKNSPPDDLEEFIDPLQRFSVNTFCFGQSRYTYRRKTDVAIFMEVINAHYPTEHPVQRFMDDWNRSSAGQNSALSENWIIRPYQHTGRFGEQIVNVELVDIHTQNISQLTDFENKKGNVLNNSLARFDRQAGYPFAWYFYMLKGTLVDTHCAESVYRDISGDFAYLPKRDEAVLRDWIASPYNV
jgi:hypothetical protein